MQKEYTQFANRKAGILAISIDNIDNATQMTQLVSASYPVLSDVEKVAAKRYGVLDVLGDGVAAPAVFILNRRLGIEWRHVGANSGDRPSAKEMLQALDELNE